jgi:hypothetical protein
LRGTTIDPRAIVFGLNPGQFFLRMRSRHRVFACGVREYGSYSGCAATHPYDQEPWLSFRGGRNRYVTSRLRFAADWLSQSLCHIELLIFEMCPWRSTAVTGPMRPPAEIIDWFVWQPAAEIDTEYVFAFGQRWTDIAEEYDDEIEPHRQRLDELWSELSNLADETGFELPDRPEPEIDVDESDALFDSRRHWLDQLRHYHAVQGRDLKRPRRRSNYVRPKKEQTLRLCEWCGVEFTSARAAKRFHAPTCAKAARRAAKAENTPPTEGTSP